MPFLTHFGAVFDFSQSQLYLFNHKADSPAPLLEGEWESSGVIEGSRQPLLTRIDKFIVKKNNLRLYDGSVWKEYHILTQPWQQDRTIDLVALDETTIFPGRFKVEGKQLTIALSLHPDVTKRTRPIGFQADQKQLQVILHFTKTLPEK